MADYTDAVHGIYTSWTCPDGYQFSGERRCIRNNGWSRWYLIDDRKPGDKEEIEQQLQFFRSNHIEVQYVALEGTLPQ